MHLYNNLILDELMPLLWPFLFTTVQTLFVCVNTYTSEQHNCTDDSEFIYLKSVDYNNICV